MKPLAPNTLIQNRYLVVQLIGKGGMGDVYLAVDQRLGSAIALKRTFFSDDENLSIAFEREAKMLARLRHAALPKVSDHFTESDIQYLVMEHITGDDLSDRLKQNNKPFPVSWVLFWADQLLDALSYLHSHEPPIIHRDIKPQNLKLTTENNIILLDFGLAKNSIGETRVSTTGNVVAYTPNYASMEQIRGTGTTARSDIYSLSATMYQLLSNIVPADALSRADNLLNNIPDSLKPLSELNNEVSPAVSAVIMRGLSLSAEQRYATARDMQIALREAFSQVQNAMAAQTVAFNIEEELKAADSVQPQSDLKTVAFSAPVISEPTGEKTEVMPLVVPQANVISEPVIASQPDNFDATVAFIPPPAESATEITPVQIANPPIGEKTEVMPINLPTPFSEKTEVLPNDAVISVQDEKVESQPDYYPEATVPIIALNNQVLEMPIQATQNFVSNSPPPTPETEPMAEESVAVPPPPIQKKKAAGGGKMFAIIGVLLALGIVGLAVVGGGVYMFKPELLGISATTPTPTPTVEPSLTPSLTPTPEPTLQADNNSNTSGNTSTDLTNTNSGSTNTPEVTPTPIIATDKTPTTEKPGQPTPTKVTQTPPKVVTQTTPPKTTTTTTKTPPKTNTTKTPSRTDVLQ